MEPNEIFRIEKFNVYETDLLNIMLENGWKVTATSQIPNMTMDGAPEVRVTVLAAATKEIFDKFPREKAEEELKVRRGDLF